MLMSSLVASAARLLASTLTSTRTPELENIDGDMSQPHAHLLPDFDPTKAKVAELRGILLQHDVSSHALPRTLERVTDRMCEVTGTLLERGQEGGPRQRLRSERQASSKGMLFDAVHGRMTSVLTALDNRFCLLS